MRDESITKAKFAAEFMMLWAEMVEAVYLKPPSFAGLMLWERGWLGTKFTPLGYVQFIGDPSHLTNRTRRGQKAREARWAEWLKNHQEMTT